VRAYYRNGLLLDLAAVAPFNIILPAAALTTPLWVVAPLRLLRTLALARLFSIFLKLEFHYLNASRYTTSLKTIIFLVYLWHWSSCFWFFLNSELERDTDYRWIDLHDLGGASLAK
jgi:hypothetical protein